MSAAHSSPQAGAAAAGRPEENPFTFAVGLQVSERAPFVVQKVTSVTDATGFLINGTIEAGDIVCEVDNATPASARDILFGAKDSVVKLTMVSASGSDFECSVIRNMPVRVWQRYHRTETLVGRPSSGDFAAGLPLGMAASPKFSLPASPVAPRMPVSSRLSAPGNNANGAERVAEHDNAGMKPGGGSGYVSMNRYVNGSAYGPEEQLSINPSPEEQLLVSLQNKLEPVNIAMGLLCSGSGVPLDLLKGEGEYVMSTLGLVLEDDIVSYITPGGPAQLAGSVQLGDRVVAVDSEAVSADNILECMSKHERVGNLCTLTLERWEQSPSPAWMPFATPSSQRQPKTLDVKLPRSSRPFVNRAEHMAGLLEEHRRILDIMSDGATTELHTSLDIITIHLLECEDKRIQRECDQAAKLSKIQAACIAALQAPIESHKTSEALVHQCTYQRHRANHLEKMLQETLGDLARATGFENTHTAEALQAQLRKATEAKAQGDQEIEELRSLLNNSSIEVQNLQLELARIKGEQARVSELEEQLRLMKVKLAESDKNLADVKLQLADKDRNISELMQHIADLTTALGAKEDLPKPPMSDDPEALKLIEQIKETLLRKVLEVPLDHITEGTAAESANTSVGLIFEQKGGKTLIVNTLVGSPAFGCQKLHAGDELTAVDGKETQGLDIVAALRGANVPGSSVTLTVRRAHGEVFEVSLKRVLMEQLMDLKRMHDIMTKAVKLATRDHDAEEVEILKQGYDLFTKIIVADHMRDEQVAQNVTDMQSLSLNQLDALTKMLQNPSTSTADPSGASPKAYVQEAQQLPASSFRNKEGPRDAPPLPLSGNDVCRASPSAHVSSTALEQEKSHSKRNSTEDGDVVAQLRVELAEKDSRYNQIQTRLSTEILESQRRHAEMAEELEISRKQVRELTDQLQEAQEKVITPNPQQSPVTPNEATKSAPSASHEELQKLLSAETAARAAAEDKVAVLQSELDDERRAVEGWREKVADRDLLQQELNNDVATRTSAPAQSKVTAAADRLWAQKRELWAVCKLLLTLTPPDDETRINKLRTVQKEHESADEPVAQFLLAIQGFKVDVLNDALLILDAIVIDSTDFSFQALNNLSTSLVKVPHRVQQIRSLLQKSNFLSVREKPDAMSGRSVINPNDLRPTQLETSSPNPVAPTQLEPYSPSPVAPPRRRSMSSQSQSSRQSGDMAGIGMLLIFDGKGDAFVKELIRDGAADDDGTIHIGDQVVAIDGVRVHGMTSNQIVDLIRGPAGSWIDVALHRQDARPSSHASSTLTAHREANVFAHLMRLVSGQRALKGVTPPLPGHHRPTSLPT